MLRAVRTSWWSRDYKLLEGDTVVAIIDVSGWQEAGELNVKGATFRVYREGLMSGAFILEGNGQILARAEKPSALHRSFLVEHGGRQYTLEAESAFLRKFVLFEGGQLRGSVSPGSAFTRSALVDFPDELPLAVRIFMFWLVMILWKRDSDAASA